MGHDSTGFLGWGMGGMGLLFLIVIVLVIAALVKYLISKDD